MRVSSSATWPATALLLFVLAEGATRYRHGVLGDTVEPTAPVDDRPRQPRHRGTSRAARTNGLRRPAAPPVSIAARPALALVRASPSGGAALVLIGIERTNLGIVASGPDFGQSSAGSAAGRRQQPLRGADASHRGMFYRYQRRGDKLAPMPLATGCRPIASAAVSSRGAAVIERRGGAC